MMPTRRRTREHDRAHRIEAERALNSGRVAERNQPPPFDGRSTALDRRDSEQMPHAGHTFEFVSAALLELES
jgi:hypothetical protein